MRRAFVVVVLVVAGCGSGSSPPPGLTAGQAQGLLTRLQLIRDAATTGNKDVTEMRLRGFAREVVRLRGSGALDVATAAALVRGAAQAEQHAAVEVVPPAPAPAPLPPGQAKKKKKHDKHGKEGDD